LLIGDGNLLKQLGTRLQHPDRSIWAHLTNEALAPGFARLGLNPIAADLSDPFLAKMTVANADVIYHLAGKRVHGRPAPEPTDLKILRNILSSLPSGSPQRYIFESSLEVYDGMTAEPFDEKVICRPKSPAGKIWVEAERELLSRFSEKGFPAMILRAASVYAPMPGIYNQVREGRYQVPADMPAVLHRIYIEDYLDLLVQAMEKGRPGQIYNIADQEPHSPEEYFKAMAASLGVAFPVTGSASPTAEGPPPRYRNEKFLREFGFSLRFPTFREGLVHGIEQAQLQA
jgi:nucleoside-diphosphate-sugar epimerase